MPAARWRSIEDLRPHLDPLVAELGRMPTQAELMARKRSDLTNAIRKFGGVGKAAEALGYPYEGPKSWRSVEDLRPHLDPLVDELGRIPGKAELERRRRFDLAMVIHKFGGPRVVAAALGYPYEGSQSWDSVVDLRTDLDPIAAELGRMPKKAELRDRRRSDLIHAIQRFGGFPGVASALGYPHKGRNAWRSVEELRLHLKPFVDELGRMPSVLELEGQERTDLIGAIGKFGGFPAVATALGYPYEGPIFWDSLQDLRPHLDPLVVEFGRMPGQLELKSRGRWDVISAIDKFGGFPKVAEALGYPYEGRSSWDLVADLRPHLST